MDVLTNGFVNDRVASSVVLVRENNALFIDPGTVASRDLILNPLHALGVHEDEVIDVIFSYLHPTTA